MGAARVPALIHYVVLAPYASTMCDYLETWGAPLRDRIRILPYHEFLAARQLLFGTYILADIERLTPAEATCAAAVCDVLAGSPGARVLNHPLLSLRRRPLLERLYAEGRNKFRVWPATEADRVDRFPVFVRRERQHGGSLTRLLHSPSELRSALRRMRLIGRPPGYLLVVEFCETRGRDALYRKCSAFLLGDRIVPRHLIFSRRWMLNKPDLLDDGLVREEREFLESNPLVCPCVGRRHERRAKLMNLVAPLATSAVHHARAALRGSARAGPGRPIRHKRAP